jgi:Family of unknown function (DUF695).
MKLTDKWFSAVSGDENDKLVIVTGRDDIMDFVKSGKFKERAEIYWKYEGDVQGMPSEELSAQMEQVEEVLRKAMEKDKLAILTGVYTGGGQKTWVFICRTVRVFGERLNEALSSFDLLPIEIYTEKDPNCEEYLDMLEMRSWAGEEDDEE